jgi:hypothetical protein
MILNQQDVAIPEQGTSAGISSSVPQMAKVKHNSNAPCCSVGNQISKWRRMLHELDKRYRLSLTWCVGVCKDRHIRPAELQFGHDFAVQRRSRRKRRLPVTSVVVAHRRCLAVASAFGTRMFGALQQREQQQYALRSVCQMGNPARSVQRAGRSRYWTRRRRYGGTGYFAYARMQQALFRIHTQTHRHTDKHRSTRSARCRCSRNVSMTPYANTRGYIGHDFACATLQTYTLGKNLFHAGAAAW